jgi:hypothetical protein
MPAGTLLHHDDDFVCDAVCVSYSDEATTKGMNCEGVPLTNRQTWNSLAMKTRSYSVVQQRRLMQAHSEISG